MILTLPCNARSFPYGEWPAPCLEINMKTWKRFALPILLAVLIVLPAALAKIRRLQPQNEAPTGFTTPTLSDNPGSQSVSNGLPEPPEHLEISYIDVVVRLVSR